MSTTPPKPPILEHAEAVKRLVEDPPEALRPLAFAYRQSAARRRQLVDHLRQLEAQLEATRAEALKAQGAEVALHDALCAMGGIVAAVKPQGGQP